MKNPVTADRLPDSNSVQPTNADTQPDEAAEPVLESKGRKFKHAAKEFFTTRKIAYLAIFAALSKSLSVPAVLPFLLPRPRRP